MRAVSGRSVPSGVEGAPWSKARLCKGPLGGRRRIRIEGVGARERHGVPSANPMSVIIVVSGFPGVRDAVHVKLVRLLFTPNILGSAG